MLCQFACSSVPTLHYLWEKLMMESATVSLLGHCLQMSHPADKNPLCRATPSLSVTRMKYEYSISVEIIPMISTKSSIWTAQLATMTGSTFCEAGRGTLRTHAVSWSTNAADPFANTKYICDKTILADCIDPPEHQPSSLGLTNCCGADQHYLMTVMYSKINKLMKWKLRMWPWIIRAEEQPSVWETWQHRFLFIDTMMFWAWILNHTILYFSVFSPDSAPSSSFPFIKLYLVRTIFVQVQLHRNK